MKNTMMKNKRASDLPAIARRPLTSNVSLLSVKITDWKIIKNTVQLGKFFIKDYFRKYEQNPH